jgi:hypothetical protein
MYEEVDRVGQECFMGLAHWIDWIGEVKGRES